MCGRAAYSARAVAAASFSLGTSQAEHSKKGTKQDNNDGDTAHKTSHEDKCFVSRGSVSTPQNLHEIKDNLNMGPGTSALVIRHIPHPTHQHHHQLECTPMIWGLIPNNGTSRSPHFPPNHTQFSPSPHYKMFNARSETLYEKRSFSGLIQNGQTCIFCVEGYYEWTFHSPPMKGSNSVPKPTAAAVYGDRRKQPYFTCRRDKQPLLLAGLWSCVGTGLGETISTFTILTTDAHPTWKWIHHRQPVILWDVDTALEWLNNPTPELLEKIRRVPNELATTEAISDQKSGIEKAVSPWESELLVYPVTKKMNDGKYRGDDCTSQIKLEKNASVKAFFSSGVSVKKETSASLGGHSDAGGNASKPASGVDVDTEKCHSFEVDQVFAKINSALKEKDAPALPSHPSTPIKNPYVSKKSLSPLSSAMAINSPTRPLPIAVKDNTTPSPSKRPRKIFPSQLPSSTKKARNSKHGHGDITSFFKVAKK